MMTFRVHTQSNVIRLEMLWSVDMVLITTTAFLAASMQISPSFSNQVLFGWFKVEPLITRYSRNGCERSIMAFQ